VSKTLTFVGVWQDGAPSVLGRGPAAIHPSDAVADELGHMWVARPKSGGVLVIGDPYPASGSQARSSRPAGSIRVGRRVSTGRPNRLGPYCFKLWM